MGNREIREATSKRIESTRTCKIRYSKYDLDLWLYQKKWQSLIYGSAFLFSLILGTWLQTLFLFISFNAMRPCFPKTFHHDDVNECIKWSLTMFWSSALSLLAFPIYITVSGGLIIGMLCCYILHLVECWHLNRKELIEITKPKLFSLQTCTKKQLISRCKECNLKPQEMRRAIWIFADNLSNDEIILADYKITGVMLDYDTIYKIKSRLKKKLS